MALIVQGKEKIQNQEDKQGTPEQIMKTEQELRSNMVGQGTVYSEPKIASTPAKPRNSPPVQPAAMDSGEKDESNSLQNIVANRLAPVKEKSALGKALRDVGDPKKFSQTLYRESITGSSRAYIEKNPEKVKEEISFVDRLRNVEKHIENDPMLKTAMEDPGNLAIFATDPRVISLMNQKSNSSWARGERTSWLQSEQADIGKLIYQQGGIATPTQLDRLAVIQSDLGENEPLQSDRWLLQVGSDLLHGMRSQGYILESMGPAAAVNVGGKLTDAGLKAGSPLAGPFAPAVAAAGTGVNFATTWGSRYLAADAIFEVERNSMVASFAMMKDSEGEPLDGDVVNLYSNLYGATAAGMEYVSFGRLAKLMPGKTSILNRLGPGAIKNTLMQMAKNPITYGKIMTVAKSYTRKIAEGGMTEGITEAMQEVASILAEEGAFSAQEDRNLEAGGGTFERPTAEENLDRVGESAYMGALVGVGFVGAGGMVGAAHDYRSAKKAQAGREVLQNIGEHIEGPLKETFERNPKDMGKLIGATQFESQGIQDIYVDGKSFQDLLGSDLEHYAQKMEMSPEEIQKAAETGQDIKIPVGKMIEVFGGTEYYQEITENGRVEEDGMSPLEADDFERVPANPQIEVDPETIANEENRQKSWERAYESFGLQIQQAGRSRKEAEATARILADSTVAQAERVGLTPEEYMEKRPLVVTRRNDPKPGLQDRMSGAKNFKLGSLSEKYESSGDPGVISSGEGDYGGVSYGAWQLASNLGKVDHFMEWLGRKNQSFYQALKNSGEVNSEEFKESWRNLAKAYPNEFKGFQHAYIKEHHYDPGVKYLKRNGFDISKRSKILHDVLWSNGVQHGGETGASAFVDAAKNAGKDLENMTDAEIIRGVYTEKINNPEWTSGAQTENVRQSLINRWNSEMNEALAALDGDRGIVYGQPITEDLDLDDSVEVLDLTSFASEIIPHQKDIHSMIKELAKETVAIPKVDLEMVVNLPTSSNKAKHIAFARPMVFSENRQAVGAVLTNIVDVVEKSVLVEVSPRREDGDEKSSSRYKGNVENYYRFFAPVKLGQSDFTIVVTAEELKGEIHFDPKNVTIYEITPYKQKRTPVAHADAPKGGLRLLSTQGFSISSLAQNMGKVNENRPRNRGWKRTWESRKIDHAAREDSGALTVRDLLAGIKDVDGVPYINEDGSGNFGNTETYQQKNRGQVEFTPAGKRIISLFKGQNVSTVIHEAGHVYLQNMAEDVLESGATEQLKKDFKTVRKWLEIGDHQIMNGQVHFTTEQHEKFAKGFESYLAEGKAPSMNLKQVFRDFKKWLLKIYKNARNIQEINPEIWQVFDRILATEEQMQEMQDQQEYFSQKKRQMKQLLSSIGDEKSGRIYRELEEEATATAEENLLTVTMDDLSKERVKWLADRRKSIGQEIEADLQKNHPVYRVIDYLEDAPESAKIMPGSFTGEMAELLVSEKGTVTAEDFAALANFESIEEMAMAFSEARPLAEVVSEMTNQEMAILEGGILAKPDLMDEASKEALYNDKKIDVLAAEVEILDRAMEQAENEVGGSDRFAKAKEALRIWRERSAIARNTAKAIIGGTVMKEISPRSYVMRARRHAGKAMRYIQLGKMDLATREKDMELLNAALANEAYKALQEQEKMIRDAKRLNTKKADIGFTEDYTKPIRALIHAYRLVPQKVSVVPELADFSEVVRFMEKQAQEKGFTLDLPEWIEKGIMTRQNFREMPLDKVRDIYQSIKQIEHFGKEAGKGKKKQKFNDLQDKIGQVVETIYKNLKKKPRGAFEEVEKSIWRNFIYSHQKIEFLIEKMDGYEEMGTVWRALFEPLAEAGNKQFRMTAEYRRTFKRLMEKHFGNQEDFESITQKQYEMKLRDGSMHSLTGEQMLALALNWGNEGNRDRVLQTLKEYKIDVKDINKFFDENMTEANWNFVKDVWQMIDSYWPEIANLYKEWTGATPEKVMPAPIVTKYGVIQGGYFPIAYDPTSTKYARMQEEKEAAAEILGPQFISASTRNGHTKARTGFAGGRILLNLDVIDKHLTNVIQDLSYGRAVVETNQVISNPEFENAVKSTLGLEAYEQFRPWLVGIARPDPAVTNWGEQVWKRVRMGTTAANMAWKVTTAIVQPLGATMAIPDLGAFRVSAALTQFYKDFMTNNQRAMELIDFVKGKSAFMSERAMTFDRDINDSIRELKKRGKLAPIYKYSFHMAGMADLAITVPLWNEAYIQGIKKFKGNDIDAIHYADKIIRQTQGSGNRMDLAGIQRGSELMKLFTMHYSFFNVLYNTFGKQWGKYRAGKTSFVEFATAITWVWIIQAALDPIMKEGLGQLLSALSGGDDDFEGGEFLKDIALEVVKFPTGSIILLRDIANAWGPSGSRYSYKMSPAASALEAVTSMGNALWDGEPERLLKSAWRTGGTWYALPVRQVESSVGEILNAIIEGEDFSLRRFFLGGQ